MSNNLFLNSQTKNFIIIIIIYINQDYFNVDLCNIILFLTNVLKKSFPIPSSSKCITKNFVTFQLFYIIAIIPNREKRFKCNFFFHLFICLFTFYFLIIQDY